MAWLKFLFFKILIGQVTPPASAREYLNYSARPQDILEAKGDVDAWKLEVERVAPSLKVTVKLEARDWRSHLEQIHAYRSSIDSCLVTANVDLGNNYTIYSYLQNTYHTQAGYKRN